MMLHLTKLATRLAMACGLAFVLAIPQAQAAAGVEYALFFAFPPVGVATTQYVDLVVHNDFCSETATVRFAAVNAITGVLLGTTDLLTVYPGEGKLVQPFGTTGPPLRIFAKVGVRISCPVSAAASIRFEGPTDNFQAEIVSMELVDKATGETMRKLAPGQRLNRDSLTTWGVLLP